MMRGHLLDVAGIVELSALCVIIGGFIALGIAFAWSLFKAAIVQEDSEND